MSLTVKAESDGFQRTLVPAGAHVAYCFSVVDMGTQRKEFKGEVKNKRKVHVGFEFPEHMVTFREGEDPQPLARSKDYTASLHEKAGLRKDLQNWRGRAFTEQELDGFELKNVLGVPALVTISHDNKGDRTYDNITSITSVPAAMKASLPPKVNEPYSYDIDLHPQNWDRVPDWLKDKIKESPEFQSKVKVSNTPEPAAADPGEDDNVPF